MEIGGAGGGLMLALAAGLWLAYLVPNWLRRQQFDATERNAVRLQRTMRVLAETAEGPAAAARRLSAAAPPASAVFAPPAAAEPAGSDPAARFDGPAARSGSGARLDAARRTARRVRRSRLIASAVLLGGLIAGIAQVAVSMGTGWSVGGVLVAGLGGVAMVSAVTLLRRLAAVRVEGSARRPAQRRAVTELPDIELPETASRARSWTPVPMPRPKARPEVAPSTMADPRIAAAAAAEQRDRADRGADREIAVMPAPAERRQPAAAPAAPAARSRFAAMGQVDQVQGTAALDLDAALARRRA